MGFSRGVLVYGFGLRFFYVGLPMGRLVVASCGSYSGYFGEFRVDV